jgi:hypothetical protein
MLLHAANLTPFMLLDQPFRNLCSRRTLKDPRSSFSSRLSQTTRSVTRLQLSPYWNECYASQRLPVKVFKQDARRK